MHRKLRFLKTASRHCKHGVLNHLALGTLLRSLIPYNLMLCLGLGAHIFYANDLGLQFYRGLPYYFLYRGILGSTLWIPSSVLCWVFQYFMGYDIRRCDTEQILKIEFLGEYRCSASTNRF